MRHEALLGRKVAGRFTITRFLGEGGMASVFVAERDAEPRRVALKIMNPEFTADRAFVRRFQREAKAAARVKHPNSVKIFEYGIEGSLSYIVMELLAGDDLYVLLEQDGAISQVRAVRILAEVCDVLVAAHEMGVVHRDLKPENIMVIQDPSHPDGERVKVLDFGIAKILDTASGEETDPRVDPLSVVTRAGTFIGTPAYMSPEQCGLLPVDTRADLYTCGVLLFQLITGKLPFEGETPLHTATLHIHAAVPAPSSLAPGIDPRLDALIVKALSKRPADRHQTARQLGEALREILEDLQDIAVGVGPISRRQPSSMLPREGLGGMPPIPAMPPPPRRIPGLDELPIEATHELSVESARTLVSGAEAGGVAPVLLHPGAARAMPTGEAERAADSLPEISLQLPSWGNGAGEPAQNDEADDAHGEEEGVEDESTLTMLRPELGLEPPFVRVNVRMMRDSGAQDATPAGREVKATLRSAADFGLGAPEKKAEIGVVGVDGKVPSGGPAPPTPQSPQLPGAAGELVPKRATNTIRMSSPSLSTANPLPPSMPPSNAPVAPSVPVSHAPFAPSAPVPVAATAPVAHRPSAHAPVERAPLDQGSASLPAITSSSVQLRPIEPPLAFASTAIALPSPAELRALTPAPTALPQVHVVRAPEPGWLSGKRGVVIGFLAGMLLTVLLLLALLLAMGLLRFR